MNETSAKSYTSFSKKLSLVKESEQDFEWYPSTPEMIKTIREHLAEQSYTNNEGVPTCSVLDCGAGDGRVLSQLTSGPQYAIEKSVVLIQELPESIFIVGTDFHSQQLIDKSVDVIFSNPPYSEFEAWATKIITEANAQIIYLILPKRWRNSQSIKLAIESRSAKTSSLGLFNFFNADRTARGEVEIVSVKLCYEFSNRDRNNKSSTDPFGVWFSENFKMDVSKDEVCEYKIKEKIQSDADVKLENKKEVILHKGLIATLEDAYQEQLAFILSNYKNVAALDPELLGVIGVNINSIKGSLKLKIDSLKDVYWRKLFDNLEAVTSKLSSSKRDLMLGNL